MNPEEKSKLKDGDIIRNTATGNAYTVLRNLGDVVIAARTIEIRNAREWELVYTTRPVPALVPVLTPPTPTEMVTELEANGWTYDGNDNRWTSPDGYWYHSLDIAYRSRVIHPSKADMEHKKALEEAVATQIPFTRPAKSFSEARAALISSGWTNVYSKTWRSPSGSLFTGTLFAYRTMMNSTGGNPS